MPVIDEAHRCRDVPELYSAFPGTSPGLSADPPWLDRTLIGMRSPTDIPSWEQLRVLRARTERMAILCPARRDRTGSNFFLVPVVAEAPSQGPTPARPVAVPSIQEQTACIRSALSLQMKELAQSLGVERPTVYSWLHERNVPHGANRDRLHALYRLAKYWDRISRTPLGTALYEADAEGVSILALLTQKPLPIAAIQARLGDAARRAASVAPGLRLSVRELAAKHGIDLRRVPDSQDDFDLETGKGFLPE